MIGGFRSILNVSVFHGPLIRGEKVTFLTVIGGFRSISALHGPLIADIQIFKNATVDGDLNFRFRMLLKGAVMLTSIYSCQNKFPLL